MAWTVDQQNAISARGGSILVSAAAGSGKTSVLTERVVKMLTDEVNPVDASQLLIVTFTKAAASEMRERIVKALRKLQKAEPGNLRIKRQLLMLPAAEICTMDSFCARLVRENFHLAGLAPDFSVLTEGERAVLETQAAEETMEKYYSEASPEFLRLAQLFTRDSNDRDVTELISKLYRFSEVYPYPDIWLSSVAEMYNPKTPFSKTLWYKILSQELSELIEGALEAYNLALTVSHEDAVVEKGYADNTAEDISGLVNLSELLSNGEWDDFVVGVARFSLSSPAARGGDAEVRALCRSHRKIGHDYVDKIKKLTYELPTTAEHIEDCEFLYPAICSLVSAVGDYSSVLNEKKNEQNKYGFSDILHYAIRLLVTRSGERTELAKSLSEHYREILIDEYQDTNLAQECLFEAITGDNCHIFSVGDVKQSIYGFRQAMPELFIRKKDLSEPYNPKNPVFPASIQLKSNFRSRRGVTEAVNFFFLRIMSRATGGVDYAGEELVAAAKYADKPGEDAELIFLDVGKGVSGDEKTRREAQYVAEYIKGVLESGVTVGVCDEERPVRAGDFAILLRKNANFNIYSQALASVGIGASAQINVPFFTTKEISFVMSLLRAINNPLLDVPLTAVMMSAVFGFTPDELADIRGADRRGSIYGGLKSVALKGDVKASAFLAKLDMYRGLASAGDITRLIDCIYDDTAIFAFAAAWQNGEQRRRNLLVMREYAYSYGNDGTASLSGFVRYIEGIEKSGNIESSTGVDALPDKVSIISIHKSKGLEFPYVLLCGLDKQLSVSNKNSFVFERKCGLGLKISDMDKFCRYKTASFSAANVSGARDSVSEELRVLYVAMTRAREHLTMVYSVNGEVSKTAVARSAAAANHITPTAIRSATSFGELMLTAFASHPDAHLIREILGVNSPLTQSECGMRFAFVRSGESSATEKPRFERTADADEAMLSLLREKTGYIYPHTALNGVLAKRTASSFAQAESGDAFFAKRRPDFLSDKLGAGERGTAVHKYLELCSFACAAESPEAEGERLLKDGKLSAEELSYVDYSKIRAFLSSPLGKRILVSTDVIKEYEFTVSLRAGDVYTGLESEDAEEQIIVDGKLDCAFIEDGEYVIVDYKTDRVKSVNELLGRYKGQLELYKTALSECSGIKVKGAEIFSLELSESICVL